MRHRIEVNNETITKDFGQLNTGDVYKCKNGGTVYMKIRLPKGIYGVSVLLSVNLRTGDCYEISQDNEVVPFPVGTVVNILVGRGEGCQ